jgi:hypothetical protein
LPGVDVERVIGGVKDDDGVHDLGHDIDEAIDLMAQALDLTPVGVLGTNQSFGGLFEFDQPLNHLKGHALSYCPPLASNVFAAPCGAPEVARRVPRKKRGAALFFPAIQNLVVQNFGKSKFLARALHSPVFDLFFVRFLGRPA